MMRELAMIPRNRTTANSATTITATHLDIRAIRQSRRRVTELAATVVVPADTQRTLRPITNLRAMRPQP